MLDARRVQLDRGPVKRGRARWSRPTDSRHLSGACPAGPALPSVHASRRPRGRRLESRAQSSTGPHLLGKSTLPRPRRRETLARRLLGRVQALEAELVGHLAPHPRGRDPSSGLMFGFFLRRRTSVDGDVVSQKRRTASRADPARRRSEVQGWGPPCLGWWVSAVG